MFPTYKWLVESAAQGSKQGPTVLIEVVDIYLCLLYIVFVLYDGHAYAAAVLVYWRKQRYAA